MRVEHTMPVDGMPHTDNPECPCRPLRTDGLGVVRYKHRDWAPGERHNHDATIIHLPRG